VKFSVHATAELELTQAAIYYRKRGGQALAESLIGEFERACALLHAYPTIGAPWKEAARLLPLERFPYCVVYLLSSDAVRIVAFAHQRRKLGFWRGRR
jgi:plasmid stabilization system protein ParE